MHAEKWPRLRVLYIT